MQRSLCTSHDRQTVVLHGNGNDCDHHRAGDCRKFQYQSYSCRQLGEEAQRVSAAAVAASGAQDSQATKDAIATGVGAVIFWPSLFFIQGDKNAAYVAQLKGQMDAVQQESIRKNCGFQFQAKPPPKA